MDGLVELEDTPTGSDDPVVLSGEQFILFHFILADDGVEKVAGAC